MGLNKITKVKFRHRIFKTKQKKFSKRPICCYQPRNLYRNELDLFPLFDDYQPKPYKMVRYNPRSDPFSEMMTLDMMNKMPVLLNMSLPKTKICSIKKPKIEKPENVKVKVDSKNNTIEVSYENKSNDSISYYKEVKSLPKYISKNNSFNKIKSQIINGEIKIILPENDSETVAKAIDEPKEEMKEIEQKFNKEQKPETEMVQKQKSTTNDVLLVETEEEEQVKSDTE